MDRAEFIRFVRDSGYANKEQAERYAGDRTEFNDDDFIAVYRLANGPKYGGEPQGEKWHRAFGCQRTTKRCCGKAGLDG